jgi:hypothetical protein
MITTSTAFMRWILHRGWPRLLVSHERIISEPLRGLRVSLCLLLMPLVLGGCSMVQTVYKSSPDLAYWWIDRFVDISAEQRPLLIDDLQAYQQWHRTTQLPRYAQWLQQLQSMALQDVSEEQSCKIYREIWDSLPTLADAADAGMARLAGSLSTDQLDHLRNKLERHHRDWRRDWAEPGADDVLKKRIQRTRERVEDFYGRLDAAQQRLLRQQAERSPYDVTLSDAIRVRRQEDILTTLRGLQQQRPASDEQRRLIRGLLQRSVISPVPAHQAYVERLNEFNCRAMAEMHNSTSTEQRQAALKRLQKYERDARALMAR